MTGDKGTIGFGIAALTVVMGHLVLVEDCPRVVEVPFQRLQ